MSLKNYWYIGTQSKILKNSPLSIILFNMPIVLFRANEKVIALEDRCAHRNAPLSKGKVCAGKIHCPYHGWEYGHNGQLVNISALDNSDSLKIKIQSYHCIEQDGYIWVCPGQNPNTKTPHSLPNTTEKHWSSFRMTTRFKAPVEQCLENFLDCPHAAHVHNSWFRTPCSKKVNTMLTTLEDGAQVEYFNEPREKSLVHNILLFGKKVEMKHTDRFIAPATSRVDYIFSSGRNYIIMSHCTPINDELTEVHTYITFKFWWLSRVVRLFFWPLSKLIIKQDVQIMDWQHDNIKRFGKKNFVMSKSDLLLPIIRLWREAISNNEPTPESNVQTEQNIFL